MTDFETIAWWLPDFADDWPWEQYEVGDPRPALARLEARVKELEHLKADREGEIEDLLEQIRELRADRDRLRAVIAADHGRQFDCEDDCPYLLALEGSEK